MKAIRIIAAAALAALAAHSAGAPAQTAGPGAVAVCNSLAFDDTKQGITRFVSAQQALDREFKPDFNALEELAARLKALETALARNQREQNASSPLSDERKALEGAYASQAEEFGKLSREYKFRQDDTKARYERRSQVVIRPIQDDIYMALGEYARAKGIALLLDPSKMEGMVLAASESIDVTKDFIAFYNRRPAAPPLRPPAARVAATVP